MFLHTWSPPPVLVSVGGLTIHWYGLFLAIGAAAGWWLARWMANRRGLPVHHLDQLLLWLIIGGLIGARLYHVANEWPYYQARADQIFKLWEGGLAIHGALIAGIIIVWLYVRSHKLAFWQLTDVIVPGLALGQAIGRWGNYFNQELFGRPTALSWGIPIEPINRLAAFQNQTYFHPTFLYESLGNLLIVVLLVWLTRRRQKQHPAISWARPGIVTLAYFLLYGILRMVTESVRIDRTPIIAGVRLPIIVSGLIVAAALIGFLVLSRQSHTRPVKDGHESTNNI